MSVTRAGLNRVFPSLARFLFALALAFSFTGSNATAVPTRDGIAVTSTGKQRRWSKLPVRICLPAAEKARFKNALDEAIQIWNASFPFRVFESDCRAKVGSFSETSPEALAEHSVFFVQRDFGSTGDSLALARTLTSFNEDSGEILDADILLNGEMHPWGASTLVDPVSVLIHELGHVLGLQHFTGSLESVMSIHPYQSGVRFRRLGEYEKTVIRSFYGRKPLGGAPESQNNHRLVKGADAYIAGEMAQARALLRQADVSDVNITFAIGMASRALGDFKEAEKAFREVHLKAPDSALAWYRWISTLLDLGREGQGLSELRSLVKAHPNFYEALADLGAIEAGAGRVGAALPLLKRALELNPVHYPVCQILEGLTRDPVYSACVRKYAPQR